MSAKTNLLIRCFTDFSSSPRNRASLIATWESDSGARESGSGIVQHVKGTKNVIGAWQIRFVDSAAAEKQYSSAKLGLYLTKLR